MLDWLNGSRGPEIAGPPLYALRAKPDRRAPGQRAHGLTVNRVTVSADDPHGHVVDAFDNGFSEAAADIFLGKGGGVPPAVTAKP